MEPASMVYLPGLAEVMGPTPRVRASGHRPRASRGMPLTWKRASSMGHSRSVPRPFHRLCVGPTMFGAGRTFCRKRVLPAVQSVTGFGSADAQSVRSAGRQGLVSID